MPEAAAAAHAPILPSVVKAFNQPRHEVPTENKEQEGAAPGEGGVGEEAIILREKCKVLNDDGDKEEEIGGGVQRQGEPTNDLVYHPRTPTSVPVSRNTSFAKPSDVPSCMGTQGSARSLSHVNPCIRRRNSGMQV